MSSGEAGYYLVGLPVGVGIDSDGNICLEVYAEDLGSALREEDAPAAHVEAAEHALRNRTWCVQPGPATHSDERQS